MPLLGSHLLKRSNNKDTEDDGQLGLQSCFHCIPIKFVFGPETKDVIESNFKPKYDNIMQTSTPDGSGENKWFPHWKPFNILCSTNQKFMWTVVGTGGAAKIKNFFCPYCVN